MTLVHLFWRDISEAAMHAMPDVSLCRSGQRRSVGARKKTMVSPASGFGMRRIVPPPARYHIIRRANMALDRDCSVRDLKMCATYIIGWPYTTCSNLLQHFRTQLASLNRSVLEGLVHLDPDRRGC